MHAAAPAVLVRRDEKAETASLIFVGMQIKGNTLALTRNEHNSTMEQWTVVRMAIAQNPDIAELMTAGLKGTRAMDPASQLRLEQMLQEVACAAFHIWDRTQRRVFPKGTFELTGGALLCSMLRTPRGKVWWNGAKSWGFYPPFVTDVDEQLAAGNVPSFVVGPPV
jgi:hypothetical protein